MTRAASVDDVEIRDFRLCDLDAYVAYWHDPANAALEALGVDRAKVYPARKMREMLTMVVERNEALEASQLSILSIVYRGRTVGVHELTGLERNGSAVMHAHVWAAELRGLGIGMISYVKAMQVYFERFSLREIRFETPTVNAGANRIKEKLGIVRRGTGTFDLPILKAPVVTDTYVVERADLPRLLGILAALRAGERPGSSS